MEYYVQSNLNHDGKEYRAGDVIDLSAEVAAKLEAAGVISADTPTETEAPVVAEEPQQEMAVEPVVGGAPSESGEPSIDPVVESEKTSPAADVTPEAEEDDLSANL